MVQHYFSSSPAPESGELKDLTATLAGRELKMVTASGVFSADRLDAATGVLLRALEKEPAPAGTCLDLGCGWGPLALAMKIRGGDNAEVYAVDINERARYLSAANAKRAGLLIKVGSPDELAALRDIDVIWSNPPIRIGKVALHELLTQWFERLSPTGSAYMVVGKNLGADSLAKWLTENGFPTERIASKRGFRILRTTRASD